MIKCIIIDDEQPAINVIENYIKRIDYLELVGTATNPLTGIELVKKHKADVVFLDIQMDEMTGIEALNILDPSVQVIFCTAFSEFAVESYEFNAVDYLLKPIAFNRFAKAIKRIKVNETITVADEFFPDDYFFVKAEQKGRIVRINIDEIDYVEGQNNYVAIHCGNSKTMIYGTMKDLESFLSSNRFIRVHKSFIVAAPKIIQVENNSIQLKNQHKKIPLSKTYKDVFYEKVKNKILYR
jgi:DNA-binding LytR/AlgR family response regulator